MLAFYKVGSKKVNGDDHAPVRVFCFFSTQQAGFWLNHAFYHVIIARYGRTGLKQ
jgi:hypothetical protein